MSRSLITHSGGLGLTKIERRAAKEVTHYRAASTVLAGREAAKIDAITEVAETALLSAAELSSLEGLLASKGEAFERWTGQWAAECKRILRPGGHAVLFGSPRTFHRMVSGVEDAGLEIRDQLLWMYAQGVPKAHKLPGGRAAMLRPGYEPILLARAPLTGTTLGNVETWGTGALNIEATRTNGYWPANLTLSHSSGCIEARCTSDCPAGLIDGIRPDLLPSRLFFCAKASKQEREAGCEELPLIEDRLYSRPAVRLRRNIHPTVKPISLMRWLVRLITPPGGLVLDPFAAAPVPALRRCWRDVSSSALNGTRDMWISPAPVSPTGPLLRHRRRYCHEGPGSPLERTTSTKEVHKEGGNNANNTST